MSEPDLELVAAGEGLNDEQREWLLAEVDSLTDEVEVLSPSEWAEAKRYLPPSASAMPGLYRFDVTPYLKEPLDCLGVESPVRQVTLMKGVQIGATVGILENAIGYCIDHVRNAPCMLVSADMELARDRVTGCVVPMLQHSGLAELVRSVDEISSKKTGKTDKRIEWVGGGFLIPYGAQSANKMRTWSIRYMLRDEIDGWPLRVGRDGDPIKLTEDRTAAYESSRKLANVSTPAEDETSQIKKLFLQGDQRYYFVCCVKCGHAQRLRWRRTNPDTGEVTGMVWDMSDGVLVSGSVRYLCSKCAHPHTNADKTKLLTPENGAEWRPTAKPQDPTHRSYHLSALYSPVGMQTWEACVRTWLKAWDVENNRPRDFEVLQVFYNNVLAETFVTLGEKVRFEQVSGHRRSVYAKGQVPNEYAKSHCGSPVYLLTCAVDVQKDNLAVAVFGWCRDRRALLIDYARFAGDTEQLDDAGSWGKLREWIETRVFEADDGTRYQIALTLVDSGYRTDAVYAFCGEYSSGVLPLKGQNVPSKRSPVKEFSVFNAPNGQRAILVTVDIYKERWQAALRQHWDGLSQQPVGHFNAPVDVTDKELKELTRETKRAKIETATNKRVGWEWHRPSGAKNELWDLLVYNSASLDLIAWQISQELYALKRIEYDQTDWPAFWEYVEREQPYLYHGD